MTKRSKGPLDGEAIVARAALSELVAIADPRAAEGMRRFFKTGEGEYGEGDLFLGVKAPAMRALVKRFRGMECDEIEKLLGAREHEARMMGLLILVERFRRHPDERRKIVRLYMKRMEAVNNWDLVDLSCRDILGAWALESGDDSTLLSWAKSKNLWKRRAAIVSTWWLIRERKFDLALRISGMLLGDTHDLIHKAVGWMLREIGKREMRPLRGFLSKHAELMPRTMLRYAIERMPQAERRRWMGA